MSSLSWLKFDKKKVIDFIDNELIEKNAFLKYFLQKTVRKINYYFNLFILNQYIKLILFFYDWNVYVHGTFRLKINKLKDKLIFFFSFFV